MPPITKFCRTCRILDPRQNVCQLTNRPKDPDKDYCSDHQAILKTCDNCGNITLESILTPDLTEWRTLCSQCASKLSTCAFCRNGDKCDFETNPSTLPKIVQKRIQQGPMVSLTTVKNPDRIKETCEKNCDCFDKETQTCMKEINYYCERMNHIYVMPSQSLEVY